MTTREPGDRQHGKFIGFKRIIGPKLVIAIEVDDIAQLSGCNSAGIATFLIKIKALSCFIVPRGYRITREGKTVGIGGIEPDFHLRTLLANGYSVYPIPFIGASIISSPVQGNICTFYWLCHVIRGEFGSDIILVGKVRLHLLELVIIQTGIENHQFGYSTRPSPASFPSNTYRNGGL